MTSPLPWWRGAALYQIYPRSFADSNGDGVGDLPGITAKLDHVASLGVDGIWLSPFFTSPMADFGYDVSDYRGVDPVFGSLADFDALVARAHGLGLRVVIDQVWAHTSDKHPWFAESRARQGGRDDWYVWADPRADGTPPNNWQSVFGGPAWTWDARRRQYFMHNFLAQQPQLNVHLPQVQDALLDVASWWLKRGVDGFRLDAINFAMHDPALTDNPPAPDTGRLRTRPSDYQQPLHNRSWPGILAFMERVRGVMDEVGAFTVAEIGGEDPVAEMHAYTAPGRLDSAYGFALLYPEALTPRVVAETLAAWPDAPGAGWPSWALENHDVPRAVSRWATVANRGRLGRMAALLLASLRGNIFLYQGEELGLTQADLAFEDLRDPEAIANWPLTLSRDGARTPMPWTAEEPHAGFSTAKPWLPIPPEHRPLAVDAQEADPASLLHFTRACLRLRREHVALRTGAMRFVEVGDTLLAFEREAHGERLLCVFNMGDVPATWVAEGWTPLLETDAGAGWTLPAWSGIVAMRDGAALSRTPTSLI